MKRFRGGLVFKAHRLLYHSTLGLRVLKKKREIAKRMHQDSKVHLPTSFRNVDVYQGAAQSGHFLRTDRSLETNSASASSSLISSLLHSHANLEWCDNIKLSNLLLPWKSGTIKSLQLLSTSLTLLALEQLVCTNRYLETNSASPLRTPSKGASGLKGL